MKGEQESACKKEAKANHDRATADIKAKYAKADHNGNAATGSSRGTATSR
jgi:hypothetical protein